MREHKHSTCNSWIDVFLVDPFIEDMNIWAPRFYTVTFVLIPSLCVCPKVSFLFWDHCVCACVCVHTVPQSCLTLCNHMDCSSPVSMGFSRQEYRRGLPCPPPGDLPDPEIELMSYISGLGRGIHDHWATW